MEQAARLAAKANDLEDQWRGLQHVANNFIAGLPPSEFVEVDVDLQEEQDEADFYDDRIE